MRYLVIALTISLLTACAQQDRQPKKEPDVDTKVFNAGSKEYDLIRYNDTELGVVCYRIRANGGISCIHKNSTSVSQ